MEKTVLVEISARHVHVTEETLDQVLPDEDLAVLEGDDNLGITPENATGQKH